MMRSSPSVALLLNSNRTIWNCDWNLLCWCGLFSYLSARLSVLETVASQMDAYYSTHVTRVSSPPKPRSRSMSTVLPTIGTLSRATSAPSIRHRIQLKRPFRTTNLVRGLDPTWSETQYAHISQIWGSGNTKKWKRRVGSTVRCYALAFSRL